jgi:GNAT superfamily N-acetyltransferase
VVLELLADAAAWTASIGFSNWPARFPRKIATRGIANGELYVGEAGDEIVATVALTWSDPMFWGACADDAGYVHRLAVRRDRAGAGLGAEIIEWAARQVSAAGRAWLRLDASADNLPLCSYYERLGFEYRGDAGGELDQHDGTVRHWKQRLYERECGAT